MSTSNDGSSGGGDVEAEHKEASVVRSGQSQTTNVRMTVSCFTDFLKGVSTQISVIGLMQNKMGLEV